MKVNELSGPELDYWAAKAAGIEVRYSPNGTKWLLRSQSVYVAPVDDAIWCPWTPSANWEQGGPLIERKRIRMEFESEWIANTHFRARTFLVAGLRAVVASEFGYTVGSLASGKER